MYVKLSKAPEVSQAWVGNSCFSLTPTCLIQTWNVIGEKSDLAAAAVVVSGAFSLSHVRFNR